MKYKRKLPHILVSPLYTEIVGYLNGNDTNDKSQLLRINKYLTLKYVYITLSLETF